MSHFHTDHVGDLPAILFALENGLRDPRRAPLTLIGPAGFAGFLGALGDLLGRHLTQPGFELRIAEVGLGVAYEDPDGAFVLEACPTSNVHTGAIDAVSEHPLPRWVALGVKVCVCTDNTLLSDTTLPKELERIREIEGVTDEVVDYVTRCGHEGAFRRG